MDLWLQKIIVVMLILFMASYECYLELVDNWQRTASHCDLPFRLFLHYSHLLPWVHIILFEYGLSLAKSCGGNTPGWCIVQVHVSVPFIRYCLSVCLHTISFFIASVLCCNMRIHLAKIHKQTFSRVGVIISYFKLPPPTHTQTHNKTKKPIKVSYFMHVD